MQYYAGRVLLVALLSLHNRLQVHHVSTRNIVSPTLELLQHCNAFSYVVASHKYLTRSAKKGSYSLSKFPCLMSHNTSCVIHCLKITPRDSVLVGV